MNKQRLTLALEFGEDLVVVNKPAGISTHAPSPDRPGMFEWLQKEFLAQGVQKKLHVVHRLDKTTTGTLLFATSEGRAKELFELFKNREIKKRYVLLTASRPEQNEYLVHSFIEKVGNQMVNTPCVPAKANAETLFRRVKLNAFFEQWEAFPKTGKPHQIRLHAAQMGFPILGDVQYGGEAYPHLCLHAHSLDVPGLGVWQTFHPIFFERMGILRDRELVSILSALDRRERLFHFLSTADQCLRLSHLDNSRFRIDLFGEVLWVYWYADEDPSPADLERFEFLHGLLRRRVMIRKMQNRGANPQQQMQWEIGSIPEKWNARENGILYEFRSAQGLSPGLFLDQRENRHWISELSHNKRVLNLFSYTCGFSVAAALGDATEVISVDLSKNFLEWGKQNFSLNESGGSSASSTSKVSRLFFAQSADLFLQQTLKKGKTFDLIILDPPSFSRNGSEVWKIDKDFPKLLKTVWKCLNKGGALLCSTNFEKWDKQDLQRVIEKTLGRELKKIAEPPLRPLDFELPGEETLMKSLLLWK
jgi:23S rRNA (cytosine1962-C5)-methyltransferase